MYYYAIPLLIIIASFLVILVIIGRKFTAVRILDTETIIEVKEKQARNKIIQERLERKFASFKAGARKIFKPIAAGIGNFSKDFYSKILALEKKYKQSPKPDGGQNIKLKIDELEKEAGELIKQEKFNEAEQKYIDIIEIESKNPKAYQDLGELYLIRKDYAKAKETFEYVIKLLRSKKISGQFQGETLRNSIPASYEKMGLINQTMCDYRAALNNFKKAVELEPSNPRFLDLLLKMSIILKDKKLASKTLKSLRETDSANQKLEELEKQVKEM